MDEPHTHDDEAGRDAPEDLWDQALRRAFSDDEGAEPPPASLWIAPAPAERELPPLTSRGTSGETFPSQIGRYRVLGEIACGGIGVVVEVRDEELGRNLAMKLLRRRHRGNTLLAQRFVEEAQIAAQLQHPGIVPIHEIGHLRGRPYFTMKLVRGETLSTRIRQCGSVQGPTKEHLPGLMRIFESLCRTLAYAHARGVVHRDLKSANIMVDAFDEVQVMDWGLAKVGATSIDALSPPSDEPEIETLRSQGDGTESLVGSVMGTPAYMSPEQARGDLDTIDSRSDVFALGAILCEIFTGHPPYRGGSTTEVHRLATEGELEDAWRRIDAAPVDPDLRQLARRCLSVDPEERPWDGGEVAKTLADHRAQLAQRARQAELDAELARETAEGERRVRRRTAMLFAVVAVATVVVSWASISASSRTRRTVTQAYLHYRDESSEARRCIEQPIGTLPESLLPYLESAERALSWAHELAELPDRQVEGVTGSSSRELLEVGLAIRQEVADRIEASRRIDRLRTELSRLSGIFFFGSNEGDLEAEYRRAFGDYGIDLEAFSEDAIVEQIRGDHDPRTVISGLEEWALVLRRRGRDDWSRVLGIARRASIDAGATYPEGLVRGDRPALRAHAEAALAEDLTWPATTILLATALLDPEEDASLIDALHRHAADRYTSDPRFHLELAREALLGKPKRYEDAVAYLRAVAALWPDRLRVRIMLGKALLGLRRFEEARECFRAGLDVHPQSADAHNAYGYALYRSGDDRRAIPMLEQALVLDPDHRLAMENLAMVYRRFGRPDESVRISALLAEAYPEIAEIHFRLGVAQMIFGDHVAADAAYARAIDLDPEYAEAYCNRANVLIELGRTEDGLGHLRTGHELGSVKERWRHPSADWLAMAEDLQRLESGPDDASRESQHWEDCRAYALAQRDVFPTACARLLMRVEAFAPELLRDPEIRWAYVLVTANAGRLPVPPLRAPEPARFREKALGLLEEMVTECEVVLRDTSRATDAQALEARIDRFGQHVELSTLRKRWALEALDHPKTRQRCDALWGRIAALKRVLPERTGAGG